MSPSKSLATTVSVVDSSTISEDFAAVKLVIIGAVLRVLCVLTSLQPLTPAILDALT